MHERTVLCLLPAACCAEFLQHFVEAVTKARLKPPEGVEEEDKEEGSAGRDGSDGKCGSSRAWQQQQHPQQQQQHQKPTGQRRRKWKLPPGVDPDKPLAGLQIVFSGGLALRT